MTSSVTSSRRLGRSVFAENIEWWEAEAETYQRTFHISTKKLYYGPFCPDESRLRLFPSGNLSKLRVLELGCGGGQASIYLARRGAHCEGIDPARSQIRHARALNMQERCEAEFHVGESTNLGRYPANSFSHVLSIFSLQYVQKLPACLQEVARVLKHGGSFIASFDHPVYVNTSPKTAQLRRSYLERSRRETLRPHDILLVSKSSNGRPRHLTVIQRGIDEFVSALTQSGLYTSRIIERVAIDQKNPWNSIYSKRIARLVPPTIVFESKKISE